MFKAEVRKNSPTFTYEYDGGAINVWVPSHEWVPWVSVDEVTKYLGVNVPDTLRESAKRDPNLALGRRRDTGEVVGNMHFAVRLCIASQRDNLFDPFLQWVYRYAMPSVMRFASGRAPKQIDPPSKDVAMVDSQPEEMLNEAAVYYLALMPDANAGRSWLNSAAYGGFPPPSPNGEGIHTRAGQVTAGLAPTPEGSPTEAIKPPVKAVGVKEHVIDGKVLREYFDAEGTGFIDIDDSKAAGLDIEAMYADLPESYRRQLGPLPRAFKIDKSGLPPKGAA